MSCTISPKEIMFPVNPPNSPIAGRTAQTDAEQQKKNAVTYQNVKVQFVESNKRAVDYSADSNQANTKRHKYS